MTRRTYGKKHAETKYGAAPAKPIVDSPANSNRGEHGSKLAFKAVPSVASEFEEVPNPSTWYLASSAFDAKETQGTIVIPNLTLKIKVQTGELDFDTTTNASAKELSELSSLIPTFPIFSTMNREGKIIRIQLLLSTVVAQVLGGSTIVGFALIPFLAGGVPTPGSTLKNVDGDPAGYGGALMPGDVITISKQTLRWRTKVAK